MNRTETIQVITLLAGNYDSIAKKDNTQKQLMISTWQECLGDLDYRLVLEAVKKTMITSPYPPTIADIRKNAISLVTPEAVTAIEAWNEAYKMICRGLYMTEEEFEKANPVIKKFFRNVGQVKEIAQMDISTVNSVIKGQFLKQYEVIVNREIEEKLMPQSMQDFTKQLIEKMDIKQIGE